MKTETFIDLLARDAKPPAPARSVLALSVLLGLVLAGSAFFATIGIRPDLDAVTGSVRFLFKFVVTLALAVTAIRAVLGLSRPDATLGRACLPLLVPPVLLLGAAGAELFLLPEDRLLPSLVGHNARFCLSLIPLLALGPLVCFLAFLRRGAPAYPGLSGAIAGLAASGIAATYYAAHCDDDSPLFVIVWYSLAVLIVTGVGYLAGRRFLRW